MDGRTRVFQWVADHYPTHRMSNSRLMQLPWRAALAVLRPRHAIRMRLADYRMILDPQERFHGRGILHRGRVEPTMTAHFRRRVKTARLVVDVGANVGHYTLVAARHLPPGGRVFAFEPEPGNFACLEENLRLNGFDNVTARREALSDRSGEATLHFHATNAGGHSLEAQNVELAESFTVPTRTLDELFEGEKLDILKADTQGTEGWIIEGGRGILARSDASIYTEFWPIGMRRAGTDPRAFLATLRQLGYRPQASFGHDVQTEGVEETLEENADSTDPRVSFNILLAR